MKTLSVKTLLFVVMSCLLCTGCLDFHYRQPQRQFYLLHVKPTHALTTQKTTKALLLATPSVVSQFGGAPFVYRTSMTKYRTDYYHAFLIPPADQIQQRLQKYLYQTHLFRYITNQTDLLSPQHILKMRILKLYAEYRDDQHPKAVMAIRFVYVAQPTAKKPVIVFNRVFQAIVPLQQKDTASLVAGWNQGLQKILGQLGTRLKRG